ncbi:MAG TPA: hypothetical protein VM432_12725, partial [Bdellovibrionales bacterium]|nr:hypothetical protein [Bdellovibrionales bacterium]
IYLEIMRLTNRTASDLFIFEDSAHGIQAAHASGAHVIQVRNPEETVARIREFVSLSSDDDAFGLDRLTS